MNPRSVIAWTMLGLALGCSTPAGVDDGPAGRPEANAPASAPSTPVAAAKPPPSKRILGTWSMNLNDAPKEALAEEFKRFKSSKELADMVRVEYTVGDTEWVLRKYGAGGVYEQRWHYQILRELGDNLVIERTGDEGDVQRIEIEVGDDVLMIGTGAGKVPLRRLR